MRDFPTSPTPEEAAAGFVEIALKCTARNISHRPVDYDVHEGQISLFAIHTIRFRAGNLRHLQAFVRRQQIRPN